METGFPPHSWMTWCGCNLRRFERARPVAAETTGFDLQAFARTDARLLSALLRDGTWDVRAAAALALGKSRIPEAFEILLRMASDGNLEVRISALMALGLLGDRRAFPHLLSSLSSRARSPRLSAAGAVALGLMGDPSATFALSRAARSGKNPAVRASALAGLGLCGDLRAVPTLEKILQNQREDRDVLAMAVWARVRIHVRFGERTGTGIPLSKKLIYLLRWPQKEVRRAAVAGLGEIDGPGVVDRLKRVLNHERDPTVRGLAWIALAAQAKRTGRTALLPSLLSVWPRESHADVKGYAAIAAGLRGDGPCGRWLLNRFRSRNGTSVRCAIAMGLGIGGVREAVPDLMDAVASDKVHPEVRRYALLGIGFIGDRKATPLLRTLLGRSSHVAYRYTAAQALSLLGDRSGIPDLEGNLTDGNTFVRSASARALGFFQSPTSLGPLTEWNPARFDGLGPWEHRPSRCRTNPPLRTPPRPQPSLCPAVPGFAPRPENGMRIRRNRCGP
ncbi:MAG: HEAT repeat domain-containing protein [Planctomycetota bacterium]|jgi:HEAT repeat protein